MKRYLPVLVSSIFVLAACGSDDPTLPSPDEVVESVQGAVDDVREEVGDLSIPPVATVDNAFAPSMLQAMFGDELSIEVVNNGENPHSFTIDALEVDTGVLSSGDSAQVTFNMPDQDVQFYCTVHGPDTMAGTISVVG